MRALSVCRPYVFIVYRASMADSGALTELPGSTGGDVKVMTYQTDMVSTTEGSPEKSVTRSKL